MRLTLKRRIRRTPRLPEEVFSVLFVLVVVLILPMLGTVPMMAGSVAGLILYLLLFPDRFRTRDGSLKLAVGLLTVLGLLAAFVVALWLVRQID